MQDKVNQEAVEGTVQKELVKSRKRKKKRITMLLCWITKSSNGASGVVDLCVGGMQLKNVLIDSGATCILQ